ncbi:hypothetical protein LV780_21815 (plasmid) [Cereibacter azotoformans]|uniref:Uncharacterized protein n=1 Tax=Cereibacter azotoformans TaxID=43057 RepID=A0A2T5JPY3_9RHOB|nr:hypothetical protein [Cereibacter azotoformans]AXQ96292.1 hypothetical protein D0Z66_21565 [Cereibacter sphaeroides]MBO4170783.1 hypothetical protein [Cereibacter azotoformans]PTR09899.1 hypothetical protein C8J28_13110 [Cereibacter azotoformans]UIJ33289.1 hypothetical protein LV780_21815 [Cereibacter azotoformans]
MKEPKSGDIWRYPYLWDWQAEQGEEDGRKNRQSLVLMAIAKDNQIYFLSITSQPPRPGQTRIEVPEMERRRAKLDDKRLWVVLEEYNRDSLTDSLYFQPDGYLGEFSKGFMKIIRATFAVQLRARKAKEVARR